MWRCLSLTLACAAMMIMALPSETAAQPTWIRDNYDETIKHLEEIAVENGARPDDGESLRDIVAFALNNITRNNVIPITVDSKFADAVLAAEFTAFLQIWSLLPGVPKTERETAAVKKLRRILAQNAYSITLAAMAAEDLAVVSSPAVFGSQASIFVPAYKERLEDESILTSFAEAQLDYEPWVPLPEFYQTLRQRILSEEVPLESLINFDLVDVLPE
jgi:hypothetical protein